MLVPFLTLALAVADPSGYSGAAGSEPATSAEAKMLLEKLKQDIAQEEKAWAEETAREKEAETRRKRRHEEFSKDRQDLLQVVAGQDGRMKETHGKLESLGYREKEMQARIQALNAIVAEAAKGVEKQLATEIPYRMEKRRETMALLYRDIESGQISPEESSNRLWAFFQNERRLAQEAEVFSGDLIPEGASDPIQVKYLRVGKQLLAYASLDGRHLGILNGSGRSGYAWVREAEMDNATRKSIKEALSTAEGIVVPGFVPLPIWRASLAEVVP